jgi:hypothetical protein
MTPEVSEGEIEGGAKYCDKELYIEEEVRM